MWEANDNVLDWKLKTDGYDQPQMMAENRISCINCNCPVHRNFARDAALSRLVWMASWRLAREAAQPVLVFARYVMSRKHR